VDHKGRRLVRVVLIIMMAPLFVMLAYTIVTLLACAALALYNLACGNFTAEDVGGALVILIMVGVIAMYLYVELFCSEP